MDNRKNSLKSMKSAVGSVKRASLVAQTVKSLLKDKQNWKHEKWERIDKLLSHNEWGQDFPCGPLVKNSTLQQFNPWWGTNPAYCVAWPKDKNKLIKKEE